MTAQNDDKERLLSILHAHGQEFLSAFDIPTASKQEVKDSNSSESGSEEEWTGIGSRDTPEIASDGEHDGNKSDELSSRSSRTPDITVFLESVPAKKPAVSLSSKNLRKSFMSSKVSSITLSSIQPASKDLILERESDGERTNIQNDALLHRLVHTKLLSGSLNPELALNYAQRGKALTGRVLELAGEAKLGKGENMLRQEQRNKAAKRVRDGLMRKQMEKEKKAVEEAKDMGNYHPTLKRLYDSNPSSAPKKKRARGLRMGIGKFAGGTLKLSREEIASVTGSGKRSLDNDPRALRQRTRSR